MSDSDLLDQLSSFIFAGTDTTTCAITFAVHHLVSDLELQKRVREEIKSQDSREDLTTLPLLHAVVMESLRLNPPVHGTIRQAMADDEIPLSEPVTLRDGRTVETVHIRKGSSIHIPIEGLNMSEEIWGHNAHEFR
jgi:cytochrome P450